MVVETKPATLLPYREDHVALAKWPLLIAIGLTVPAAVFLAWTVLTAAEPAAAGSLALVGFILFTLAAAVAWVVVYEGWVLAVEITQDMVRFGALRKADRRARRGLASVDAKPYASWLYEYWCPIPALRRIWIVEGSKDAFNPERATGVPTFLGRSRGQPVTREGWIRMPFARGGLMLELDRMATEMPNFGPMWHMFVPRAASELLRPSEIWYTPVADPKRCRAALVESLQINGYDVDEQGRVHAIPGAAHREGIFTKPPPTRTPGPRHGGLSIALSILWMLVPLLTLGYLTWVVYGYAALRVRELHSTLIALAWLVPTAVYFWAISNMGTDAGQKEFGAAVAGMMALLAIGGTIFAFFMRKDVFYYH